MVPGSFYDDIFGDPGSPTTDGFLSKFCTPWSKNKETSGVFDDTENQKDQHWWIDGNDLYIGNLIKLQRIQVLSTDGRILIDRNSQPGIETTSARIGIAQLSSGVYIGRIGNELSFKFFVP